MEILKNVLAVVAPALAAMLGGPAAGALVGFLGQTFLGNKAASATDIALAIKDPINLVRIKELEQQFALAQLVSADKDKDRQTDINKIEASSEDLFKSGARPAALWIAVLGFGYNYLVVPICLSFGYPAVGIPSEELSWLLGGLLGLGAMRSYDKIKGR